MAPPPIAVTFSEVTVTLGGVPILDKVSATIPRGSCTAIVGPNGSGKTTLLLALLGQLPYTGAITITTDQPMTPPRIGYVPQRLLFDRGIPMTVMDFMTMGQQRIPLWLGRRQKHTDRARDLLLTVQAEGLADRQLGALSGGEVQRVLLALALQQDPDLLILDEPAAGVDFRGEQIFCELLDTLRLKHTFTQLIVSHDLATVTHHSSYVICLNHTVITAGPPRQVLTSETLTATFGLHMGLVATHAMPEAGPGCTASCCTPEGRRD
ncbi:MAG: metal ABC transporter ATP-binding protein [Proteobacteria bacterium]|nr:metal ABC transporter ATP-binding protein [Desulfobulbaceae bacterium]MBU4153694.1 metal ABC transporter ATP-binding protein [Pseudomonadota bacterium]